MGAQMVKEVASKTGVISMFKRLFCRHVYKRFFITKDAKMGNYIVKDGLGCGSKWVCEKCGKTKIYMYRF